MRYNFFVRSLTTSFTVIFYPRTIFRAVDAVIVVVFVFGAIFSHGKLASAAENLIDFEGLSCFTPVTTQYSDLGVTFTGAIILTKPSCLNYQQFPPYSGVNVLYDEPSLGGVIVATFNSTVGDVNKVSARVTGNRNVTLTAFNNAGVVLATAQTGGPNYIGAWTGIPANLLLSVESPAVPIARVTFHDGGNTYTIDDFTFSAEVKAKNHPPTLSFLETSPDGLSENDGIQDSKGTADKTLFKFDVIYTDQDNDAPLSVKLIVQKVNQGGFEDYFNLDMFISDPRDADYTNGKEYTLCSPFPKGNYRYRFEASDGVSDAQTPFAEFTVGYSNVAFLPGLQASRLYRPDPDGPDNEDQLWEPTLEQDVEQLFLHEDEQGKIISDDSEIYTRDIIKQKKHILWNVYEQFSDSMDDMVEADTIHEWEALPYDWRLAFDDILENGVKTGENISYLKETTSPFIVQELRRLAKNSDTGKVTIVTHSNGGLLAKYLLASIKDVNNPYHDLLEKIDVVIMVAAPQVGTPKAISGLLHGDEQSLALGILLDKETARDFAEFMPGAYNLLPSDDYFETVSDPVFSFTDEAGNIPELKDLAGKTINSYEGMLDFLRGHDGAWNKDDVTEKDAPNVLNDTLLTRSQNIHQIIDSWEPKENLKVIQLAGWGLKTIKGIKYDDCDMWFCSDTLEHLDREPILTNVGDDTVVIPSALFMKNADRYYVNIRKYNKQGIVNQQINRDHASILEIDDVIQFIKNIIIAKIDPLDGPGLNNITSFEPSLESGDKSLEFVLHSPAELHLNDETGRHTGIIENSIPNSDLKLYEKQIPNSYYFEFGEKKYAGTDRKPITVVLKGEDLGVFSLDIKEALGEDIISSARFSNIPVSKNTTATMQIEDGINNVALNIDCDSNGIPDISIVPSEEYSAKDALNVLAEIVRSLSMNEKTKNILIQKIQSAEKQVEKNNLNAANSILENVKHAVLVFSGDLTSAQDRIPRDEAEKLLRILDTIKIK